MLDLDLSGHVEGDVYTNCFRLFELGCLVELFESEVCFLGQLAVSLRGPMSSWLVALHLRVAGQCFAVSASR